MSQETALSRSICRVPLFQAFGIPSLDLFYDIEISTSAGLWVPFVTQRQQTLEVPEGSVPVEAHHSWCERMTSIYPIVRKLKIMCFIVYETQSMIDCADISHGFATGCYQFPICITDPGDRWIEAVYSGVRTKGFAAGGTINTGFPTFCQ